MFTRLDRHFAADFMGYTATFLFFIQYLPQILLTHRRKTVKGFSTTSVVIKMIGASFFMTNYLILGERWPTTLYGIICTTQYAVMIAQAGLYERRPTVLAIIFMPIPCVLISSYFPTTMAYTTVLKPLTQVLSHVPLLYGCIREGSVKGISMTSMHLNAAGGLLGIGMCLLVEMKSPWTMAIYVNSFLQAATVYVLWFMYRENEVASLE
eukprot:PhF_6_TR34691/c0_g1_i1/m.50483